MHMYKDIVYSRRIDPCLKLLTKKRKVGCTKLLWYCRFNSNNRTWVIVRCVKIGVCILISLWSLTTTSCVSFHLLYQVPHCKLCSSAKECIDIESMAGGGIRQRMSDNGEKISYVKLNLWSWLLCWLLQQNENGEPKEIFQDKLCLSVFLYICH